MCSGQGAVCRGGDDLEGGAEGVKSPGGELRGAGGELQQAGQLFLSEAGHHGPEPLHHLRKHEKFRIQTPSSLSWLQQETQSRWLTFSLKCHDPPTITAWALKSWTFISPVPHINSWGDEQRRLQFPSGSLRLNRLSLFTPHIPPTHSHQIWLAGFLEPVRSNLQFIRKLHQLCAHYLSSLMKETVTSGKKEQNTSGCSYATLLTFQEVFHLISHLAGQPVLGQQVEIMHLVFIGNSNLSSPRYELHHLQEGTCGRIQAGWNVCGKSRQDVKQNTEHLKNQSLAEILSWTQGQQLNMMHLYVNQPLPALQEKQDACQTTNMVSFVWVTALIAWEMTSAIKKRGDVPFQNVASPSPAALTCCTSPRQTPGPSHSRHCLGWSRL